jgi:hypothetical protein
MFVSTMLPLTPTDRVSDKIHCKILSYDPYERNKGFKVAVYTSDGTAYSSVPENSLSFM